VVYCFDENYAAPTAVAAYSLLLHEPAADLHLVTTGGPFDRSLFPPAAVFHSADDCALARELMRQYGSHISHVSPATNLRLCLPELLLDLKEVVYLDSDTLVLKPFFKDLPLIPKTSGVNGVRGGCMSSLVWGRGRFLRGSACLLAGTLQLDLDRLRELRFGEACCELLERMGPANDQTILNLWCMGSFGQLPAALNSSAQTVSITDIAGVAVLHFDGCRGKPWDAGYRGKHKELWDAHAAASGGLAPAAARECRDRAPAVPAALPPAVRLAAPAYQLASPEFRPRLRQFVQTRAPLVPSRFKQQAAAASRRDAVAARRGSATGLPAAARSTTDAPPLASSRAVVPAIGRRQISFRQPAST
jgi:lipopolysaccharide biosynthesis glycosyltransferase